MLTDTELLLCLSLPHLLSGVSVGEGTIVNVGWGYLVL